VTGDRGIVAKNISSYIKRYLIEKYGEKCSTCGWCQRNLVTKKVPLEIDHINGNADDNSEKNLRLICPNCHSLSENFRNLNKGRGRSWRIKYLKSKNLIK
jgi:Zn finger protein HypA/HybF involved in hydrogenase expression